MTQETFLRAYKALPRLSSDAHLKPWLYRIATNAAYDVLRRRQLIAWQSLEGCVLYQESGADDDPQLLYTGASEVIRLALQQMRPQYRHVVLLSFLCGYSNSAPAQHLGYKYARSIKMLKSRARENFRQCYEAVVHEEIQKRD